MATGISKKAWLGVAKEATPGTAIATPTVLAPTKAGFKNVKKYVYLDEERGTRDGNYGRVATVQSASGTFKGNWYNDSSTYFLLSFMGNDTVTQPDATHVPTVYSHALSLADIPPTLTLYRVLNDVATYQLAYTCVEKLTFTFQADGKLLEVDGSFYSRKGVKVAGPTKPAASTVLPFAGYAPVVQLNGTASQDVDELTIELSQKVTLFYSAGQGKDFVQAYYGERTANVSFVARYDNDANIYALYDADTDVHVNVVFQGTLIANSGGTGVPPNTNYYQSLTLDFPIVGLDEVEHDSSKDNITIKGKGTARPGTADNSLFTATVQNTTANYTV